MKRNVKIRPLIIVLHQRSQDRDIKKVATILTKCKL